MCSVKKLETPFRQYIYPAIDKYEKLNIFRDQKYDGCSIDIYIIERFENIMIHDWHKYFHLKFHTSYTISFSARCLIISVSTRLFFQYPSRSVIP